MNNSFFTSPELLQKTIDKYQEYIDIQNNVILGLRKELYNVNNNITDLKLEIDNLENEQEEREELYNKLMDENSKLTCDNQGLENRIKKLIERIDELNDEKRDEIAYNNKLEMENSELRNKLAECREKNLKLNSEIVALKLKYYNLDSMNSYHNMEETLSHNTILKNDIIKTSIDNIKLKNQYNHLNGKLDMIKSILESSCVNPYINNNRLYGFLDMIKKIVTK